MMLSFLRALTTSLLALVLVFSPLFIAPQRAHAIPVAVVEDIPTWVNTGIIQIKSTLSYISQVTETAAMVALQVDAYVLQPLAFVLSGNLLKIITQGVINFVIGKANGTGVPQFVADIQASMQLISDQQTLTYLNEYMRSSRSPYAGSIVAELRRDYLNKTSLAGFWAQNMDTLRRTSPNPLGYLRGNWLQGGVTTWMALTTQQQNNPYWLIQSSQSALASLIGPGVSGVTAARALDIRNGQGFVSWCGEADGDLGAFTTTPQAIDSTARIEQAADEAYNATYQEAYDAGLPQQEILGRATVAAEIARNTAMNESRAQNQMNGQSPVLGVNPGDPCTLDNGKTGTIKTPGSVILAGLNKALGGQQDSVVRMGNVGPEINTILGNMATVIRTVDFAAKILGGPGSGGLFGVDDSTRTNARSLLRQYADAQGNLGVTNASVLQNAARLPSAGPEMLDRASHYETSMNTIRAAATTASTSVSALIEYCVSQQQLASSTLATGNLMDQATLQNYMQRSSDQIQAAQNTLTTVLAPIFARTDAAFADIAAARAMVERVQVGLNAATTDQTAAQSVSDMNTLRTMSPTPNDVADAQQDATAFSASTASANPQGSLNVTGRYLMDKLHLISTNATALQASCTVPNSVVSPTINTTP